MTWLQANGQWLGAIGTLALAIATFVIVRQNRKLLEHNRLLLETSPIKELIVSVINPIIASASSQKRWLETQWETNDFFVYAEARKLEEARKYLKTNEGAVLLQIGADTFLLPRAFSSLYKLSENINQILYEDLKRRFKALASKIDAYNPEGIKELLLELLKAILNQNFRNKIGEIAKTNSTAYEAVQPCDNNWANRKLEVFCAYRVLNKLLISGTTLQQIAFRYYVGIIENEQRLEELWRGNSETLMAIIKADAGITHKASQVLQESYRLQHGLKEVENQLSEERNKLKEKYNFTEKEIQNSPEEQSYSEYAETYLLA
jgi:hypothetical protein